jgi:hypothetical protein
MVLAIAFTSNRVCRKDVVYVYDWFNQLPYVNEASLSAILSLDMSKGSSF